MSECPEVAASYGHSSSFPERVLPAFPNNSNQLFSRAVTPSDNPPKKFNILGIQFFHWQLFKHLLHPDAALDCLHLPSNQIGPACRM